MARAMDAFFCAHTTDARRVFGSGAMVAIVWPQTFDERLLFHGVHLFGDGPKSIFRFEVGVIYVGIAMCAVGAFAAFPLCFIFFVVQIFNADFASPPRWQFTPRMFFIGDFFRWTGLTISNGPTKINVCFRQITFGTYTRCTSIFSYITAIALCLSIDVKQSYLAFNADLFASDVLIKTSGANQTISFPTSKFSSLTLFARRCTSH